MNNIAIVIPAYNEVNTIRDITQRALSFHNTVVVIDDGSDDRTSSVISDLPIILLRNDKNQGKAASLWKGMQTALRTGALHIITMDADGQHRPEDIPRFIECAEISPNHIILGTRSHKYSVPLHRYCANKFANLWISIAAGYWISDSQSGFRLYPASLLEKLTFSHGKSNSFVFESEILIKAKQHGFRSIPTPIPAIYNTIARPSHYRPIMDTVRISLMVLRYIFNNIFNLLHINNPKKIQKGYQYYIRYIGLSGMFMFLLSKIIIFATGGLSLMFTVNYVYRISRRTRYKVNQSGFLLVFGICLKQNNITHDYLLRLERAKELVLTFADSRILLLGGITGHSKISEAEAGKTYLVKNGIPVSKILLEDVSRHTLENLKQAKKLITEFDCKNVILITNRYHLARTHLMAHGLGITHQLCAAEKDSVLTISLILRILKESVVIHWYYIAKWWANVTNNKKILNKIT